MAWFGEDTPFWMDEGDDEGYSNGAAQVGNPVMGAPYAEPAAPAAPPAFEYTPPPYMGATRVNIGNAPRFVAPEFDAPEASEIYNNPAYQFRVQQGIQALQNSAAARGMVRHGGTYKGLIDYGQNAASQEFDNAYNRYLQEYDRLYRGASDAYAPRFSTWQARNAAALSNRDFDWQRYVWGIDDEFRREQLIADLMARAEAGQ